VAATPLKAAAVAKASKTLGGEMFSLFSLCVNFAHVATRELVFRVIHQNYSVAKILSNR
jgi:hypothetical protein